jgi:hypothetical protein
MLRIRHRETGCWLLVEPSGRDVYVGPKDKAAATQFASADEARAAAQRFKLTPEKYQIQNDHSSRNKR